MSEAHDELRKRLTAYRDAKALYESPDPYDREEARYEAMHVAGGRIGHDEALALALLDERVAARATLTKAESALESATKTAITAGDLEAVAQAGGHHHRGMLERTTTYMAYQTAWTDRLNAEVNLGHAVRRQSEQLTEATVLGMDALGRTQVVGELVALLDEVERLRAIFTDAGQGEHNVLALVEHYQQAAMEADERLGLAYPRALQAAADVVLDCAARWRAMEDSVEMHEIGDSMEAAADRILDLSAEEIDIIASAHESHAVEPEEGGTR